MRKVMDKLEAAISAIGLRSSARPAHAAAAPTALAVLGDGPGLETLPSIIKDAGWDLVVEHSTSAAITRQQQEPAAIVLYDRGMTDGDWREAVVRFARLTPRPCLVLLSLRPDKNLWDELVRYGGFELLRIPVDRDALLRTVGAGWSIWQNQRHRGKPVE